MGMDQPNGEHSDGIHTNGGMKGYDSPVKGVDSQTLIPHYNGKGKDVIALYRSCPFLLYFDWLFRFWIYFDKPAHWISWYAAGGFFFGGICFIIGSFTAVAPAIYLTAVVGNCMGDPFDWWVTFMYFVGDCLWFVATSFQIIEALNTGWDTRYFEWQRDGCKGPPPRYRWFGLAPRNLDWWGAISYTVGVGLYWIAAVSTMINDCPNSLMAPDVYLWLVDYFYLIAGILFALAGAFYCMHEISPWLIPAIFVPTSWRAAKSMKWWAMMIYFWGGVLYCIAGCQLYWFSPINTVETLDQYNIITGVGFGGGSICFFTGATLLLARQSRGRCKPSYADVGRLDPTIYKGQVQPALNARRNDDHV
ncbi:hypothetical protein CVIRNUC_008019 [Coccomyxa viridis]|uniref:Uncharacterized protein n=1 Tax=Coccomyxa viridis TaxID=1274662 RepID=A0AAV1IEZ5_9CHLO|nr:hypothetical protein CVIRNUC_008019 [Coccomyxa viridis]